jgi:hypothetical protein|tara:strand:- start:289 stop:489 length:201 start_codon:yes stop_codon:yes gene_type:complete
MEQKTKHRLAWLALFMTVIVIFLAQGCAMFEEQMASMGFAGDKDIILCEGTECEIETPVASEDVKG